MTKILVIAVFTGSFAVAATAQPTINEASGAARSYAQATQQTKTIKVKKNAATTVHPRRTSSHSPNPEYDVYVRGEYVGSDPDPRIRATIRQEATRNYGFR